MMMIDLQVLHFPFCNAFSRPTSLNHPKYMSKCRHSSSKTTAELHTPPVNGSSSYSPSVQSHKVTVHDRQRNIVHEFFVPEDQYILHTAESHNISLPFACRHGCCTSCAVRVKSGQLRQPEALGISAELKSKRLHDATILLSWTHDEVEYDLGVDRNGRTSVQLKSQHYYEFWVGGELGYALLCVGFPLSDLEVETQDEDEVYWLQFGRYFARGPVERDDYALELAMADE